MKKYHVTTPVIIELENGWKAMYTENNGRYYVQYIGINQKTGLKVYGNKIRISKYEYESMCGGKEGEHR